VSFSGFGGVVDLIATDPSRRAHVHDPIDVMVCRPAETVGLCLARFRPGSGRIEFDDALVKTTVRALFDRDRRSAGARFVCDSACNFDPC